MALREHACKWPACKWIAVRGHWCSHHYRAIQRGGLNDRPERVLRVEALKRMEQSELEELCSDVLRSKAMPGWGVRQLYVDMADHQLDPPPVGSRWANRRGREFVVAGAPFDPGPGKEILVPVTWDERDSRVGAKPEPAIALARFTTGNGSEPVRRVEEPTAVEYAA